jgi:heme-degrading monooxygenase HmoA
MIVRIWRGWVASDRASDYVDYINRTGLAEYKRTSGNRGAQMLTRDLGDDRTEVLTISWWDDLDAVRAFAGEDVDQAVFYPEDEGYLIDRDTSVTHYAMASRA